MIYLRSTSSIALAAFALLTIPAASNAASKAAAAKPAPDIHVVPEVAIPPSVFVIPGTPNEGRNPFFPQSAGRVAPQPINPQTPLDSSWFVLNGITSPPRRTAMINGRTFEAGEEGEVRLPSGGKALIKCVEIKAETAVIETGGHRRELRFRSGL